uniref:Pleckstrin homology domain containing, family A member 5 n=1 Tax=Cyprinus carpio TaxID=7962 RepID=A0A8C1JEU1_CYPCA
MAADLNPEWLSCLPSSWSYGVTRDGRVFFINEEAKSTTWLHPVTGEAVITGHRKTPDLPTGWEEGYTFEGARCYINHNERKVTCKHPVTVISFSLLKKERPTSTMSEASNYTGGSDYTTHPSSPTTRLSRSSKKVHNFGKRSNSIKRNPNAPVVKNGWLYKQDSTGMKMWKKRWFVLSDMCLFYYRDEKEEGILGSILLPSFHISMLSVDDHITRKYAFKATHPNMRTYYFSTDTAKDMESWMKVMTDAALVHSEPIRSPQEMNNMLNHRVLTRPEIQNNERNRETLRQEEKKQKAGEKYGFQKEGAVERPLTKINSIKLQPAQAAAIAAAVSASKQLQSAAGSRQYKPAQVNGSGERGGDRSPGDMSNTMPQRTSVPPQPAEPERTLSRTNSMQQLEQWVRTHRTRAPDDDTRSITSYQTLPRNMPSHRAQIVPRYPEGYRTLPRNMLRPDSICSVAGSMYDRALQPTTAEKRRSIRDDTMWQLYEWQQRQAHSRIGYGTLPSPKTMGQIAESIPTSPSHGSLAGYHTFSPNRPLNPDSCSEVSSPVFRGDVTIERRHRPHLSKYSFPAERRPVPPAQSITAQSLQGKTVQTETYPLFCHNYWCIFVPFQAKLSRLCEQDKVVRNQAEKLQQLHREKHTLETALLSASQEIEMSAENPAAVQSVIQQRDVLQSGLLSTCREVSRVSSELERSWREYDRLEADATMAKTNLLEQLEALGSPQTEPPSQKHVQIQKELWRIQDVMEALNKNKPKRNAEPSFPGANPLSNLHKSEGPDYRLYKSEPELTTVAEVDESNGEDKSEQTAEKESPGVTKGVGYPVGVVSPRTKSPMPESSTIASYVTLRKSKKPDPRTDRPRSAVEHMSSAVEVGRTRMSVEEQMERIRKHQQGALRERRREDGSLSRSLSFTKDNLYYTLQVLEFMSLKIHRPALDWTSVNVSSISCLSLPLLFPQTRKKSPVISPDEQDTSPEEQPQLTTKPTDAEENCRNTEDVESGNANLENKVHIHTHKQTFPRTAVLEKLKV